ncbi:MAG: hypothetical protein U0169_10015 [Polyangiaceae bacterium]
MVRVGHGWMSTSILFLVACASACASSSSPDATSATDDADALVVEGSVGIADERAIPKTEAGGTLLRVVASNTTSGNGQSYDPGEGTRMLQALAPDVALVQEFNYGSDSAEDIRSWVDTTFGSGFSYVREASVQIPNGVVSRYPILESGSWRDSQVQNRGFAWARIDVPGPKDLWAVSLHLLTTGASTRRSEADQLVGYVRSRVPSGDYVVFGGDFNTGSRGEACITTFGAVVATKGPYPVDQRNNANTNASRSKPYDWVLASPNLDALATPVAVGTNRFPAGLVLDSRVFAPLADVAPVRARDSAATNMQHMPVVRDFVLPP